MDFAFCSATTERDVAGNFADGVPISVFFEIAYISGCPGVDISELSVYPGQKEVLFPPCTGFSLALGSGDGGGGGVAGGGAAEGAGGDGVSGESAAAGAGAAAAAGQVRVRVTPTAAI